MLGEAGRVGRDADYRHQRTASSNPGQQMLLLGRRLGHDNGARLLLTLRRLLSWAATLVFGIIAVAVYDPATAWTLSRLRGPQVIRYYILVAVLAAVRALVCKR